MAWVPAFDESYDRVPISQMEAAWNAGYRVIGGYAGGGNPDKWISRAEIEAWLSRPGTGIVPLFEIGIADAVNHPERGATHAHAARTAWRALGCPDHAAIHAAVDTNVTLAQARGPVATYFRNWNTADTCLPVAYVEEDAGAILVDLGLIQDVFTPAAYGWNDPPVLYTPTNAPGEVDWTQEHNGRLLFGGNLDIGHIRTSAPIWWAGTTNPGDGEIAVALTQDDANLVRDTILATLIGARPAGEQVEANPSVAWALRGAYYRAGSAANTQLPNLDAEVDALTASQTAEAGTLAALQSALAGIQTTLAGVPAAVVAALPTVAGGEPGFTDAQLAQIGTTVAEVLGRTTAALTVAPPAAGASGG